MTGSQPGHPGAVGRCQPRSIAAPVEAGNHRIVAGIELRQIQYVALRQAVAGLQRFGCGIQPIVLSDNVA